MSAKMGCHSSLCHSQVFRLFHFANSSASFGFQAYYDGGICTKQHNISPLKITYSRLFFVYGRLLILTDYYGPVCKFITICGLALFVASPRS